MKKFFIALLEITSLTIGVLLGYYGSFILYIIVGILSIILIKGPIYNPNNKRDIAWVQTILIFFGLILGDLIKYFKVEYLYMLIDM